MLNEAMACILALLKLDLSPTREQWYNRVDNISRMEGMMLAAKDMVEEQLDKWTKWITFKKEHI